MRQKPALARAVYIVTSTFKLETDVNIIVLARASLFLRFFKPLAFAFGFFIFTHF
jgi:hypothetical protein